jgi:hypothetical protein
MKEDTRALLGEQPLVLEVIVQMRDELPVAVPDQRRPALASAEHMLRGLALAPMWDVGIDIGPEAILVRLECLPERYWSLVREGKFHNRLDRLEKD